MTRSLFQQGTPPPAVLSAALLQARPCLVFLNLVYPVPLPHGNHSGVRPALTLKEEG
jgi:hypothetical protein